ncbi:Major Facilitator Superfamily protein [Actinomadura rubteroloni]|uniref:Major Facilitator Superfamily protein n=1 Tax=Actinomadura rubteroloni TaxID=1926885 RepID=A0A2P4UFJ1_9ACTN|nr:MFS transporter [Actinomadura rubteroloni]POM23824.1 Major Facilitator Superfamily protein [Actinomadura rubteroloni]
MFTRSAAAASCVGFVAIGALQALYGPAIPAFRAEFGLGPSAAGLALSAHFTGALLGVGAFHRARARTGDRLALGVGYALLAVGSLLIAFAPSWPAALAGAAVAGLGFGAVDYGLNLLFAVGFGTRGTAMLNLLNAHFGVGAILGPALLGRLGPDRYPWAFAGCAVVCLALLPGLAGVRSRPAEQTRPAPDRQPRVLPLVLAFVVIYVLHVAIETGVGGWEPTHLAAVGYGAPAAAIATSGFWLAMTAGRFGAIPLSLRFTDAAIVTWCCAGMTGFLLLAAVPGAAPYAYAGVGLAIGPIFPTALPWLRRTAPGGAAGAFVVAASMVGGVAFPPLLGAVIEVSGVRAVPLLLAALAAVCTTLAVSLAIRRMGSATQVLPRRENPARRPAPRP